MSKMELYHVKYQLPKFGSEGEFLPEAHEMSIVTAGGKKDAEEACKKYHSGCKIVQVLTHLEDLAEVDLTKKPKKGTKKK